MFRTIARRLLVLTLSFGLVATSISPALYAGMLGTDTMVQSELRESRVATVEAALAREDVRAQLERFGVDAAMAAERVSSLSDQELENLSGRIESLPAGAGLLEVVGIVFVVVLILDLLGIVDVFKRV